MLRPTPLWRASRRWMALGVIVLAQWAVAADPGGSFVDCAECPRMSLMPAGRFTMGALPGEEDRERLDAAFRWRSEPRRAVSVDAFVIGVHEVTRAQYRRFAEATGRRTEGCFVWSGSAFVHDASRSWFSPGFAQDDDHPAVCVSWDDARAYVEWLSKITGKRYRLPSEAEWEYAARAGGASIRVWGDDAVLACAHANGADRTTRDAVPGVIEGTVHECTDGHAYTAPVGSYRPNAFGVHDVLGNAAEWTQDCWTADYANARADARANTNGDCSMRVVRGGAWDEGPAGLRVAYRVGSPTTIRVYGRGFRVARDP